MKRILKKLNHVVFLTLSILLMLAYPLLLIGELIGAGGIDRALAAIGIADGFELCWRIAYCVFIPWLLSVFLKIRVFKD